ncbi:hypothetical protein A6395_01850 [Exiguobacterium sp. SH31]|uniref:hypothetical protein n=3 Tax=Exiguobacterium TaxID=33986 RepID=UPI0008BBDB64|nr:hypothetical protein [Exiguobacterium sp. SH0S7]OGX80346.1 hypothetical protein A6395_01850 [Exiguobacterium sp. SH31]TCI72994.1 hypothetical protein EVJ22_00915 [Exiguobacterium sp. SH0S7]
MDQHSSLVLGSFMTAEEFSILTISPLFIINVVIGIGILVVVFSIDVESWKDFFLFLGMTIWASVFVSVYAMAWYVRIKYDTSPDFSATFGLDSFPGWGTLVSKWMHEPHVTQNALINGIVLIMMRKENAWYIWLLKAPSLFFVSLFFIKYIPVIFQWLFT